MAAKQRWMLLGVAGLALVNGGCIAVAAGAAAAGAGAAGYAYVKGRFYRDYPANPNDTFAAVQASLADLHFPIVQQEKGTGKSFLESKTTDGTPVRIDMETLISRIPAEGQVTRVYIRVGAFGDEMVSARIFDQTALHFVPPGPGKLSTATLSPPTPPLPPPPVQAAGRPFETSAPPLAGGTQPAANWTPAPPTPPLKPTPPPAPTSK